MSCDGCIKRYLGCHDSCQEHQERKKKQEQIKKRYKELNNTVTWNGYDKAMKKRRDR